MKKWSFIVVCVVATATCKRHENAVARPENDPEMRAAMEEARANAREFWRVFDDPARGESGFAVKVPVKGRRGVEYVWATEVERVDGKVSGTLQKRPTIFAPEPAAQRVEIDRNSIVDWAYRREGKTHGNYTLGPSLKWMSPEEADKARLGMGQR